MRNLWDRIIRWLAREHIAYLEYENKELRYEGELWRHRYEGAMDALRVFERRYNWLQDTVAEASLLKTPAPMVITNPKE